MLADKWPRQLPLTVLLGLGLLLVAGSPRAALASGPGGPVPVLDRGRVGHTVALPGGQRAYRAEGGARAVSVLDSGTGAGLETITTGFRVDLLAISEDSRWLYGMSPYEDTIIVIDVGSNRVVGTILMRPPAPPAPDGL